LPTVTTYLLTTYRYTLASSTGRPERGKGSSIVGRGGDEGGGTLARTCGRRCIAQLSETLRNRSAGFGQPRRQPRVTSLPRLWLIRRHSNRPRLIRWINGIGEREKKKITSKLEIMRVVS